MPHACIATNSRSADSRPNATRRPISSAIGMVSASACGTQRQQHARDQLPGHALGDQLLGVFRERRDDEEEREDQQPDQERQQDLADHVPVEDPQHLGCSSADLQP